MAEMLLGASLIAKVLGYKSPNAIQYYIKNREIPRPTLAVPRDTDDFICGWSAESILGWVKENNGLLPEPTFPEGFNIEEVTIPKRSIIVSRPMVNQALGITSFTTYRDFPEPDFIIDGPSRTHNTQAWYSTTIENWAHNRGMFRIPGREPRFPQNGVKRALDWDLVDKSIMTANHKVVEQVWAR